MSNIVTEGKSFSEKLMNRPAPADVEKAGIKISSDKVSNNLQPVAAKVEKKIVENRVSQSLKKKKDQEESRANRVKISDRVQNVQGSLETNIKRDQVGRLLSRRSSIEDLKHLGITKNNAGPNANSIQGRRRSLEYGLSKSQLSRNLTGRTDYVDLIQKGVFEESNETSASQDPALERSRIAMALKCTSRLHQLGMIDDDGKARLKKLVLDEDKRVGAAVEVFEADHNIGELLDTLCSITNSTAPISTTPAATAV